MKKLILVLFLICNSASYIFAQEGVEVAPTKKDTLNSEKDVFIFVDVPPTFPDGDDARLNFISMNIRYPEVARDSGIQGTVYVTFIVEIDGSISNIKILRGIGGGCDEEVIKLIQNMPKWIPGQKDGKVVRCQFNMPIKFFLAY